MTDIVSGAVALSQFVFFVTVLLAGVQITRKRWRGRQRRGFLGIGLAVLYVGEVFCIWKTLCHGTLPGGYPWYALLGVGIILALAVRMVWSFVCARRNWRSGGNGPDGGNSSGGAGRPAPLFPLPPTLVLANARALPAPED